MGPVHPSFTVLSRSRYTLYWSNNKHTYTYTPFSPSLQLCIIPIQQIRTNKDGGQDAWQRKEEESYI
jgi:hypothetical protein